MKDSSVNVTETLGNKVVKDNLLIQKAKNDLTLNEQKLINLLISLIKPGDKDFKKYYIKVTEFSKLTGVDNKHVYGEFKKIAMEISKKSFWFENDEIVAMMHWVIKPKYYKKTGLFEICLDPDIKDYLIGLSGNFTEYELYNILSLKSKYSISLYELFKSHSFKHSFEVKVDELKEAVGANIKSYKNFGVFKLKVLEKSLDDINEYTDIDVSYICLDSKKREMRSLRGCKVEFIKFIINSKGETERLSIYQKTSNRLFRTEQSGDHVPHQISLDTDNETTALFDDTTNQQIN